MLRMQVLNSLPAAVGWPQPAAAALRLRSLLAARPQVQAPRQAMLQAPLAQQQLSLVRLQPQGPGLLLQAAQKLACHHRDRPAAASNQDQCQHSLAYSLPRAVTLYLASLRLQRLGRLQLIHRLGRAAAAPQPSTLLLILQTGFM